MLKTQTLTPEMIEVISNKGTELPFSGKYNDKESMGTYLCRQCGLPLFRSHAKFHSGCGWPAFDDEIEGAVKQKPDMDGRRTEIVCARCNAHLGHVFRGEGLTSKNLRHCVNSLSLDFVPDLEVQDTEEALLAGGCFWGVEHYLNQLPGVLKTESGYAGGSLEHPTYQQVCQGNTGHIETVRVVYDPTRISYQALVRYFFEIHDPTQFDGQGPDKGAQYLGAVFYYNSAQQADALDAINELKKLGYNVVTQVLPAQVFWAAEDYHQAYYQKTGKTPYCHRYVKRF